MENTQISPNNNQLEVRAFGELKKIFDERNWPFPIMYTIEKPCNAIELANLLNLPTDKIEAVFINGSAYSLDKGIIHPGDRVAYVPPGTPGPYRLMLGLVKIPPK
jgi:hypothetical protein